MKVQLELPHVLGSSASLIGSEFPHNSQCRGLRPSLCPTLDTRESSHLAYKDTPFGVYAQPLLGTTIWSIVKPGALWIFPFPPKSSPAFLLPLAAVLVVWAGATACLYAYSRRPTICLAAPSRW